MALLLVVGHTLLREAQAGRQLGVVVLDVSSWVLGLGIGGGTELWKPFEREREGEGRAAF